jgi:NhaA family Na+:H+ antiporter
MWYLMLKSGVHATLAGVMLAFAIPFTARSEDRKSPSHRLEHWLQKPVAFVILPVFALVNTGIPLGADWMRGLADANSVGIALGLAAGKPLGVTLLCLAAVAIGICRLPSDLKWPHVIGAGLLGGIGFTMSIFIAQLAFADNPEALNASKTALLLASLAAGVLGYLWLRAVGARGKG